MLSKPSMNRTRVGEYSLDKRQDRTIVYQSSDGPIGVNYGNNTDAWGGTD